MRISKSWKANDGAALVEFAITIPILLLVVWSVVDFARAYYTSNSLSSAVREGARVGAVLTDPCAGTPVKDRVKGAFNAFGGPPVTDAEIKIYVNDVLCPTAPAVPSSVTVEVKDYQWLTTTPITFISGGQILMTRKATFRYEREPS